MADVLELFNAHQDDIRRRADSLARDYALGERWRKQLHGDDSDASGRPTILEFLIWVLAALIIPITIKGENVKNNKKLVKKENTFVLKMTNLRHLVAWE